MPAATLDYLQVLIRILISVTIGSLIGAERVMHGRAAGIRTHILVCLGACMTSMTGLFVSDVLHHQGDVLRISAQVVSGIGFLGAGMIILKNNNVIAGLTTAAGVWATGAIGVAVGYGFYYGAALVTVAYLLTIVIFVRFEKRKKMTQVIYVEIDDMYRANAIVEELRALLGVNFIYRFQMPKSGQQGHLGVDLVIEKRIAVDMNALCEKEHIVFAQED